MSSATTPPARPHTPLPIRELVALRSTIRDRELMDYLHIRALTGGCGCVATAALREAWGCDQSTVSRRMNAVAAAGLADITAGGGQYQIHGLWGMEGSHEPRPPSSDGNDGRDPTCVAAWPDCVDGAYDPRCCRFPKSCSCGPR
jgi:hypothetical protein